MKAQDSQVEEETIPDNKEKENSKTEIEEENESEEND